jgi:hypothetical protein
MPVNTPRAVSQLVNLIARAEADASGEGAAE